VAEVLLIMGQLMRQVKKIRRRAATLFSPGSGRRVDFVICGTQKGGTTALDAYLREHPEVCMADRKEVHFFDTEAFFASRSPDYSTYHAAFSPNVSHKLIGEATPIYMYWRDAPRRIWEYNRDMKLVVVLRNPIERAFSHWNMERAKGADDLSFWDAIHSEEKRCREALPYQHRVFSYVDRGFYLEQLRRLWSYFPREQVLILKNEVLKHHPCEALREVCDFLGVAHFSNLDSKDVHSRPYESRMSSEERRFLQSLFEYEIRGLERELGWDCSDWLTG
jgi:hypothetical protein